MPDIIVTLTISTQDKIHQLYVYKNIHKCARALYDFIIKEDASVNSWFTFSDYVEIVKTGQTIEFVRDNVHYFVSVTHDTLNRPITF